MKDFKGRHFEGTVILGCIRWYCKYGISYRNLEEMMLEEALMWITLPYIDGFKNMLLKWSVVYNGIVKVVL